MWTATSPLRESPFSKANFFSRIFFWWLNGLMGLGYKKDLELLDLYQPLPSDRSAVLGDKLSEIWAKEVQKSQCQPISKSINSSTSTAKGPKFVKALIRHFGLDYMALGILLLIEDCFTRIAQPICLGYLIRYFGEAEGKDGTTSNKTGYLLCGAVVLGSVLYNLTHHTFIFCVLKLGMQIRIACCSLIYRKALKLSQASLSKTTVGQMVNLLSNDVNRFDQATVYIHYLWIGILQVVFIHVVLWIYIGPSCLVGFGGIFLLSLCQGILGRFFSKLRKNTSVKTDQRVRLMNEIISSISVIKMYVWENAFSKLLDTSREEEVKVIRKRTNLRALNLSLYYSAIKIIVFFVLLHFVLTGNGLTAEKVFVVLSLYNNISILWFVSESGTSPIAEALVSISRIQKFLLLDDHEENHPSQHIKKPVGNPFVKIFNASAMWGFDKANLNLKNINLSVGQGERVAVIGRVGSSKSSLLNLILGEMGLVNGSVDINGSIGYVSQSPWIFAGTVRENILFGKVFECEWYNSVVESCGLTKDFKSLLFGDQTNVGEKGSSLSGGQKARIALARAVYADADIYLLDDCLSAVDANVGQHIFNECIKKLLASKAVLLVTHQTHFAEQSNRLYRMENGNIFEMHPSNCVDLKDEDEEETPKENTKMLKPKQSFADHFDANESEEDLEPLKELSEKEDATNAEFMAEGKISGLVYWKYFRAGSNCFTFTLMIAFNILAQLFYTGSDYWLNIWSTSEEKRVKDEMQNITSLEPNTFIERIYHDRNVQLWIFTGSVAALLLFALLRSLSFVQICMKSSINLHKLMFKGVLTAPMDFFHKNSIGRILNRFGKDIGQIDDILPTTFLDTIGIFLNIFGIMIVTGIVNPILLIPAALSLVIFYFLRAFYLKTARAVKRLEGNARSPCFSHLSNSMVGLTTIRSFKMQKEFEENFDCLQDLHTSAWFLSISTSRWFGIWLDWISVVFIAAVTFSFMFANNSPGEVGLAVSSAMLLTGMLQWGARQSAEVENQMVSVERILQYTKIPPEENSHTLLCLNTNPEWPTSGEIKVSNLFLKYGDNAVLKNLNFQIRAGEKVGIVGRTGAGKTSLLTALFRLAEPSGVIEIDGINIQSLPLRILRSKLSIIPQEPILFATTLRNNLDPDHEYSDSDIWKVLNDANLVADICPNPAGLYTLVSESGGNLSLGQRQLICLVRAILKRNKIIILDEASSNLDSETDNLIQKTIRRQFVDCTVITVAHRLGTVMDSDRIMLLENGEIKEFDVPFKLLQNENSYLSALVEQTGNESSKSLREIAAELFRQRHHQP